MMANGSTSQGLLLRPPKLHDVVQGVTTGFGTNPRENNKTVDTLCTTKFGAVKADGRVVDTTPSQIRDSCAGETWCISIGFV